MSDGYRLTWCDLTIFGIVIGECDFQFYDFDIFLLRGIIINSLIIAAAGIIALIVISLILLTLKKPAGYTFYPAIFMLVTTASAIIYQTVQFFQKEIFY